MNNQETFTHDGGGYNNSWMWAYIGRYKNNSISNERIIWVMTSGNVHDSMWQCFEGVVDNFGNIVKVSK